MTKWEYMTVIADIEGVEYETPDSSYSTEDAMLEDVGLVGWELVCVVPIVSTFLEDTETRQLEYYFKRPKD